jgi:hypothetical protein
MIIRFIFTLFKYANENFFEKNNGDIQPSTLETNIRERKELIEAITL